MLQRIYGTAWAKKEELEPYLHMLEEAEKRDHRKLGRAARPVPHAGRSARAWCSGIRRAGRSGSRSSSTCAASTATTATRKCKGPQILDRSLWEKTGHWENYRENMFTTESEKRDYALKPMNCPGHVLIFNSGLRSYRDLPLRYGEFGQCHRNEPSGALHGIMRVRGFTQDDGHIFCTEDQILGECVGVHTGAAAEGLPRLRLHRHHLQGRDAAGEPHRLRRDLGQGRARAARGACARCGVELASCPARARSTARRSNTR